MQYKLFPGCIPTQNIYWHSKSLEQVSNNCQKRITSEVSQIHSWNKLQTFFNTHQNIKFSHHYYMHFASNFQITSISDYIQSHYKCQKLVFNSWHKYAWMKMDCSLSNLYKLLLFYILSISNTMPSQVQKHDYN